MEGFEIDLDSECVWLDEAWMSRDELKRKITSMLEAGDYRVARPSQALEALTKSLTNARLLALRISPDMSDALNAAAQQMGRPVGSLAREALAAFLASAPQGVVVPGEPSASHPPPPAPVPQSAALAAAEPVSAEEAAGAVTLVPKRKEPEPTQVMEQGWFGK